MFSDFPSLHPLAIHFPIVFIFLAVIFQAVVVWKLEWVQIRWTSLIMMGVAFFSALAASTFFHAMLSPEAPKKTWEIFNEHEKYAQYTLWMSGITFLLKAIGDFYKIELKSYALLVLASSIGAVICVSITGHHGARLVHIEGVGAMGKYLGTEEDEKNMGNMSLMDMGAKDKDSSMKTKVTMPPMQNTSDTNINNMGDMIGMNTSNDNKSNSSKSNIDDMKSMKMKNDKKNNKDDMKGMNMNNNDKNNKDDMKGMNMNANDKSKNDMKGMDMDKKNVMDTISLEDNNPNRNPKKKNIR